MGLCRTGPADPVRTLVVESRDRTPRSELRHPSDRDRGTGVADPQPAPGVAGRRADGVWRRSSPALRPRIPDAANDLDLITWNARSALRCVRRRRAAAWLQSR